MPGDRTAHTFRDRTADARQRTQRGRTFVRGCLVEYVLDPHVFVQLSRLRGVRPKTGPAQPFPTAFPQRPRNPHQWPGTPPARRSEPLYYGSRRLFGEEGQLYFQRKRQAHDSTPTIALHERAVALFTKTLSIDT